MSVTYMKLADVASRYGWSEWTTRDRARRCELPHVKHPGTKSPLFRVDWLDAYDEGCELEVQRLRRRGKSPGRIVRPKATRRQSDSFVVT